MPNRKHTVHVLWPLALLLAACSNGTAPRDGGTDAANDVSNDIRDQDAGITQCDTDVTLDTTLMLDPGMGPNVNVAATFDGQQLWLAYNRPAANGSGNFDVFLERMHCNGQVSVPPFAINTVPMINNVDPDLAVRDGHLYVAWAGDSGMFPDNLDIYFRTFEMDGTPLMPAEQTLETTHAGMPAPGSVWMVSLAALAGDRFTIAGSRGIDDPTPHFQVIAQTLDVHGTLLGPTLEPDLETIDQQDPALAATTAGGLYLGWSNVDRDGGYHAMSAHYEPDSSVVNGPMELTAAPSGSVSIAAEPGDSGRVFTAYVAGVGTHGDAQIVLRDGAFLGTAAPMVVFGFDGRDDEAPKVAGAPGGGAVAWYEQRGTVWELHVRRFALGDATFQLGTDVVVPITRLAPYYQPALTHVQGDTYFVAWSEGISPRLVLKGRFLTLP